MLTYFSLGIQSVEHSPLAHSIYVFWHVFDEGMGHSDLELAQTVGNPGHLYGLSVVHSKGYIQS